jgi:hypothetical protein
MRAKVDYTLHLISLQHHAHLLYSGAADFKIPNGQQQIFSFFFFSWAASAEINKTLQAGVSKTMANRI